MSYVAYCSLYALVFLSIVGAGVALVITEHYGWAWLPWLAVFCIRFRPPNDCGSKEESK